MPASIREIIKERAKEKGISLVALSSLVGVSYSHFRSVLKGTYTSRPVIRKLSKLLDLPELPDLYEQLLHEKKNANKKKVSQSKKASSLDKKKGVEKDGQKA